MPEEKRKKFNVERLGPLIGDKFTIKRGNYKFISKARKPKVAAGTPHSNVVLKDYIGNTMVFVEKGWVDWYGFGNKTGVYYNADLTNAEYDKIFLQSKIKLASLANEPKLMNRKWFDYRFLHYVEATYFFARCYSDAYGKMMQKINDVEKGGFKRGFTGGDILLNGTAKAKAAIWAARTFADNFGIPYPFYCETAVRWAVEERIWRKPPTPNQMYSPEMTAAVLERWQQYQRDVLVVPQDERYLLENSEGEPYQEEFQEWLCGQIFQRANPQFALETYMFHKPMITRQNAIQYVGQRFVDMAEYRYSEKKKNINLPIKVSK